MSELQAQFEKETGRKEPKPYIVKPYIVNDDNGLFVLNQIADYWKAYAKWLEPKAQPKAKPVTHPPSDDTKAVIASHYFQDGRECFTRIVSFNHFNRAADVLLGGAFVNLVSDKGVLENITYSVSDGRIVAKQFEYYQEKNDTQTITKYKTDDCFDVELHNDGGGNYRETIVQFKNTDAKMERMT